MNDPKTVIDRLRDVIALECKAAALGEHGLDVNKSLAQEMTAARALIPTAILGHHDRMRNRGKKSVAVVRNGVCGACHLRLPISHAISLNPTQDIEVCDNCGVFLYVDTSVQEAPVFTAPPRRKTSVSRAKTQKKSAEAKVGVLSSVSEHLSMRPE